MTKIDKAMLTLLYASAFLLFGCAIYDIGHHILHPPSYTLYAPDDDR